MILVVTWHPVPWWGRSNYCRSRSRAAVAVERSRQRVRYLARCTTEEIQLQESAAESRRPAAWGWDGSGIRLFMIVGWTSCTTADANISFRRTEDYTPSHSTTSYCWGRGDSSKKTAHLKKKKLPAGNLEIQHSCTYCCSDAYQVQAKVLVGLHPHSETTQQ